MTETATRAEHLQWCKDRALQYLEPGEVFSIEEAFASFQSDMTKHPETKDHAALLLFAQMFFAGLLKSKSEMRSWIEGFN
jgi:hypothetical protein